MFRKLLPALVAPVLLLAACAAEAEDAVEVRTGPAAAATLRAVPDEAAAAGTGAFEIVMDMTVEGHALELVAAGAFDSDAKRMSMSMDLGDLYEQIARTTGEDVPDGLGGELSVVADGSTVYLRHPGLGAVGAGSADWWSVDAGELGITAEELGFASFDPSMLIESLRGVTGEPRVVGTETVRGVETTRYAATIDVARALAQVPTALRAQVEAQLDQLGDAEIAVDVWVGDDGLPRRVQMDMGGLALADLSGETAAVMTMELFDYGQPVDIQLPAPDEVSSLSDLFGWSSGSGS